MSLRFLAACGLVATVLAEPVPAPPDAWMRPGGPWPAAAERGVAERARLVIERSRRTRYGNTFFENEKRAYGWAMLSLLGGFEEPALRFLQEEDNQAESWHRHTEGIDYYACFTLKHQVRKLFRFGERLDPDYRARMLEGARRFTERDPLRRPHHAHDPQGGGTWGPDAKNSWVDVRSTDNLRLMRETSVYLLAEASGNEETRRLYKQRLTEYVVLLYHAGMGEWDSENYLGHSIAPLLNLYDFARDEELRRLAKAALDWICISGSLKYRHGHYGGPGKRDYNHPTRFGGSAAGALWYWFGGGLERDEFESDEIHQITSGYRPPTVCLPLAAKDFGTPLEIRRDHPGWAPWETPLDEIEPTYRETHYFGERFQFGTLLRGTQNPDVNGFRLLADHPERGADELLAAPCRDPLKLGSPVYQADILAERSWVAQHGPMALALSEGGGRPWRFLVPQDAAVHRGAGHVRIETATVTVVLWPIAMSRPREDAAATERVRFRERGGEREPRWPHCKVLVAEPADGELYGFAIEVAEGEQRARRAEGAADRRPETDELAVRGAVAFTGVGGRRLRLQTGEPRHAIHVWRDGVRVEREPAAFRTLGGPVELEQGWRAGSLRVRVGDERFACTVSRAGEVRWDE